MALNPANPGDIKEFRISSNTNNASIDIGPSISEFRFYESVLSNTITATVVCVDTGVKAGTEKLEEGSVLDSLPIRGSERADINVTDMYGNEIKQEMYVNRVRNADPGTLNELFVLDFASKEFFANEQQRVVRRYKDAPISTHVQAIAGLINMGQMNVDETAGNYNFYGNDKKVFYTLTWLASKAIPAQAGSGSGIAGAAGFLFYQTALGHWFKSIDNLLKKEPVRKLIYTSTVNYDTDTYDTNILSYKIKSDIDVQQNLSLGVYNNRTIHFDPIGFSYVVQGFDISKQEGNIDVAGDEDLTTGNLINPQLVQTPSRLMSSVMDVGFNMAGTGDKQIENTLDENDTVVNDKSTKNLVQSIMRYNQIFTIQTEIVIAGDFGIHAGDIVHCDFPAIKGSKQKEINKLTSGEYLVAHVCHRSTPRDTFTSLTLVRDSFGENKDS